MEVKRYARIFRQAAINRFALYSASRADLVTFILGKFVRMGFFILLAVSLFNHTDTLVGFKEMEVLLFFAIMNMVDVLIQVIWYRGMYNLRDWIKRGKFDAFLIQPVSPLFKVAAMQLDLFDIITLPVAVGYIVVVWIHLPVQPDLIMALTAAAFFVLSMILAFSINLCIASTAFWIQENEGAWALFRDSIYVARFPSEIFPDAIRLAFTFMIPILAIVAFPARALLGLLQPTTLIWAALLTGAWLLLAVTLWRAGLRHYTSASG